MGRAIDDVVMFQADGGVDIRDRFLPLRNREFVSVSELCCQANNTKGVPNCSRNASSVL